MKRCSAGSVKRKWMSAALVLTMSGALVASPGAWAANGTSATSDPTHDFITTCTYGALAGGLVGAATLAFSNDPGNKINNVARGASLGLYVGIALGLYMLNGGPSGSDDDAAAAAAAGITQNESGESYKAHVTSHTPTTDEQLKTQTVAKTKSQPTVGFAILPMVSERGVEGASAQIQFAQF